MSESRIQEMQGLYGPFTLTERVVQKIWLRQDFETAAMRTESGMPLRVIDPGRWNLQGGPDFKEARLEIAGQPVVGDVEVHFNVADWWAHAHAENANFDRVALHVVLSTNERGGPPAETSRGGAPEVLHLLPLLNRDLEAYAADDALLELEQIDELEWVARFLERPWNERLRMVREQAARRWELKAAFAAKRLDNDGWAEACHQSCLEVLGYARNRATMSRLALRYPLSEWAKRVRRGSCSPTEEFYESADGEWRLAGLRPANHPRKRIAQYCEMVRRHGDWPERLRRELAAWPEGDGAASTPSFRKAHALRERFDGLRRNILGEGIGEKRAHTLMIDAFLPLAEAAGLMDAEACWRHWWPGDHPDALRRFFKQAELTSRRQPATNELVQGALALFIGRGG